METKLKERRAVRQTDPQQLILRHRVTKLNLSLLNLTAGPDSGTEVWPSAWRHDTLLPIRRDSLPFPRLLSSLTFPISFTFVLYNMFYLFCDTSGWLMDCCGSDFITSTGFLDMDTTHPTLLLLLLSSSWLGHQSHYCISLPVVSPPLVALSSPFPQPHHLSRWWHPSHVTVDRPLCVMSRCLILHLYPVSPLTCRAVDVEPGRAAIRQTAAALGWRSNLPLHPYTHIYTLHCNFFLSLILRLLKISRKVSDHSADQTKGIRRQLSGCFPRFSLIFFLNNNPHLFHLVS